MQTLSPSVLQTSEMPDPAMSDFNKLWYKLLTDYSRRGITKETDKIIARMGMIGEVQEKTAMRHCAGH